MALCAAMLFGIAAAPVAAQPKARPAVQPAAILTVISGDVLMRSAGADFTPALDGAVLHVGTMLRTSADARALITLFEGSTVELDPASDITIEESSLRDGSTIAQVLGRSWHVVMHLTTADSRYEPTTPAATASVRGGEYEVAAADATSGPTTMTTLELRVPNTVVVPTSASVVTSAQTSASVVTSAQTSAALAKAAPVSTRSGAGAERIRAVITQTLAARALANARARDRDRSGDRDNERDDD